jgi:hypothetical protein
MKKKILTGLAIFIFLFLPLALIIKIKGASLIRLYIESGIGTCQNIPIICMTPQDQPVHFSVNRDYAEQLIPQKFAKMRISIPKGFSIVQERVKKAYYKKRKFLHEESIMYVVHEENGFFGNLFPDLRKQGITTDYEFIRRLMFARLDNIKGFTDAFFVVFKTIFTPDVGNQHSAKMIEFTAADKNGFINYNVYGPDNYFDCNIFNRTGGYFKLYIKDKGGKLDLDKVITIISTIIEPDLLRK